MSLPFNIVGDLDIVHVEGSRREGDVILVSAMDFKESVSGMPNHRTFTFEKRLKHRSGKPDIVIEIEFSDEFLTVQETRLTLRNCEIVSLPKFLDQDPEEFQK